MASVKAGAVWTEAEIAALRQEFVAELDRQLDAISGYRETAPPWWSEPDEVVFLLRLLFHGVVVSVNAGANTAALHSLEDVQGVLAGVRKAALLGLLDLQLLACAFAEAG